MVVDLRVERIVAGGDGLAELDGLKVFVHQSAPGELVRARVTVRKRDYAVAEVLDVIEPSPVRVEPLCSHYGACGGCQCQHISYEGQLRIKRAILAEALRRLGRVNAPVNDFAAASAPWQYRNKTQFAVAGRQRPRVGFYRSSSHDVIDADACLLHPIEFNSLRADLQQILLDSGEVAYNERDHSGNVRHIIVRQSRPAAPLLVAVVTRRTSLNRRFVDAVRRLKSVTGIVQNFNPARTNRILGERNAVVAGVAWTHFEVLKRRYRASVQAFFQVNTQQAELLCQLVLRHVGPQGTEAVADLFCGVGLLSLTLAPRVKSVVGVEMSQSAIDDAIENAEVQGAHNVEFRCDDVDHAIGELNNIDVVVLDPPRQGCSATTLRRIAELRPRRVVYVSCNPATLARDLAVLEQTGYKTISVDPVDMFPQTCHVEAVASLHPI
jgi:23S rRNA (uracil1939-C5)-methyltransferase